MSMIFKGLIYKGVIVYLVDILVYAKSNAEHDRLLDKVFGLIISSSFKVNLDKSIFGTKKLNFLGHIVSAEGIQTNDDKFKKIKQAITPECVKQ